MLRRTIVVLIAFVGILAAGCGKAREAQMAAANAPTANVAGLWTGSAGTGGAFVPVTMSLSQNGTSVAGTINVGGRPDLSGGVKGAVQGQLLDLTLDRVTLGQLMVKQDTITGVVSAGLPVNLRRSP
jgi:hypothetical protein